MSLVFKLRLMPTVENYIYESDFELRLWEEPNTYVSL